jgi:hypothetical protein
MINQLEARKMTDAEVLDAQSRGTILHLMKTAMDRQQAEITLQGEEAGRCILAAVQVALDSLRAESVYRAAVEQVLADEPEQLDRVSELINDREFADASDETVRDRIVRLTSENMLSALPDA